MPLYYNLDQKNKTANSIDMIFDINLQFPFIMKPNEYLMSVTQFNLPNYSQPLFYFQPNTYFMQISYNGLSVDMEIPYESDSNQPFAIYEIQHFICMLNKCVTSLITLWGNTYIGHTLPSREAPYFTYNEVTKLMSFTSNAAYYDSSLTTPIEFFVNQSLLILIHGFPVITQPNPSNYFLIDVLDLNDNTVTGTGENPPSYLVMTQQSPSLALMTSFDSVILTTNIPIKTEFINQTSPLSIVSTYTSLDVEITTFSNNILYAPQYIYKWIEMQGNSPITNIKFMCYVLDKLGNSKILRLPPGQSAAIKLMFIKKPLTDVNTVIPL